MTPEAVRLIRVSWHQISTRRELTAVMFYGRLFELEPGLREMFRDTDFHRLRAKLIAMLDLLVRFADQPDDLIREAAQLGRRHATLNLSSPELRSGGRGLAVDSRAFTGARFHSRDARRVDRTLCAGRLRDAAGLGPDFGRHRDGAASSAE